MTREEMNDKMVELLEETKAEDDVIVFNDKAVALVKEIAEWARGTGFYKSTAQQAKDFWDDTAKASDIWMFMLQKIVGAPTVIHRDCIVAGHMPALEAAIMREAEK